MLFRRSGSNATTLEEIEASHAELVSDLRLLGRMAPLDQEFLDRLGARLVARAAAVPTPAQRALPGSWGLRAAAAGLALALSVFLAGAGVLAAGPEGLDAKVRQIVEALASKLGVPVEDIEVQRSDDGSYAIRLPEGSTMQVGPEVEEAGKGSVVLVAPGRNGGQRFTVDVVAIAARVLGIPRPELERELEARSLEEVARDHGADPTEVADAIRAELRHRFADVPNEKLDLVVQKVMSSTFPRSQG